MKFPRIVSLDSSDAKVFERVAEAGEWAVPGGFAFADRDVTTFAPKEQLAFRSGWLGVESSGRATIVEVAEIDEAEFFRVVERLARHLVERHGAPNLAAALPAAREEAEFSAGLCDHPVHTLLALDRQPSDQGVVERFRAIPRQRDPDHARIWEIVPDED